MILRETESESNIHLDFVPMVDVLFNLLIFFLLATTLKQAEREMHIALPVANSAGPISTTLREFIVNVDAAGKIYVGGRVVEPDALSGHPHHGFAPTHGACHLVDEASTDVIGIAERSGRDIRNYRN